MFSLWIPSLLGQGIQSTFFILIFFQFFRLIPKQIEESAYLDGATSFDIFIRIALPMAVPAFIIAFTYGFAVNWNEVFTSNFYLEGTVKTIPMHLKTLTDEWGRFADFTNPDTANIDFSEAKAFAGTLLSIVPLVVMYGIIQDSSMHLNNEYWLKLMKMRNGQGKNSKCRYTINYEYMRLTETDEIVASLT